VAAVGNAQACLSGVADAGHRNKIAAICTTKFHHASNNTKGADGSVCAFFFFMTQICSST